MPLFVSFLTFSFSIVPPAGLYSVTSEPDSVTFYQFAYDVYDANVLLAHSGKAGASFSLLSEGGLITLTYPDHVQRFEVTDIQKYQASDPLNVYSYFTDLNDRSRAYSSEDLGKLIYDSDHGLILQTCIDKDGVISWGRLFVIAEIMQMAKHQKLGR